MPVTTRPGNAVASSAWSYGIIGVSTTTGALPLPTRSGSEASCS